MRRTIWRSFLLLLALGAAVSLAAPASAPQPQLWTWDQVKNIFEANNTTVLAGRLNIDELKAEEITAFLRPNPQFSLTVDGTQIAPSHGEWKPFAGTFEVPGVSQLFERRHKRHLPRCRQGRYRHRERPAG